jgi:putative membrane protein insertion efficiency factor
MKRRDPSLFLRAADFLIDLGARLANPAQVPACRFEPTCSCYAKEAFRLRAPAVAAGLVARRLLRCRPFGGRGWDPVPRGRR